MSLLPELSIGWEYAWWFPAVYALITLVVISIHGIAFGIIKAMAGIKIKYI